MNCSKCSWSNITISETYKTETLQNKNSWCQLVCDISFTLSHYYYLGTPERLKQTLWDTPPYKHTPCTRAHRIFFLKGAYHRNKKQALGLKKVQLHAVHMFALIRATFCRPQQSLSISPAHLPRSHSCFPLWNDLWPRVQLPIRNGSGFYQHPCCGGF